MPEVDKIEAATAPAKLPVNIGDVVYVNAMAPAARNEVKYATRVHELRLLLNYIDDSSGAIRLRQDDFRSSALHIRRFVSESFGLGMLTAAVQSAFEWKSGTDAVFNFDALPTSLATRFPQKGARPDLLFRLPGFMLAGEARGRSNEPSGSQKQQEKRLNSLLGWSYSHGNHPLVMTWAYVTGNGATVDFFVPIGGADWLSETVGDPLPSDLLETSDEAPWLTGDEEVDLLPPPGLYRAPTEGAYDLRRVRERPRQVDMTLPSMLFEAARDELSDVTRQLRSTAPRAPIQLEGRRVHGRWVPIDPLNEAAGSFLLGILDEPLPPRTSWDLTQRLRARHRPTPAHEGDRFARSDAAITVRGELVVAVANDRSGQPWDLIDNNS
jgi:hypothetical protein